MILLFLRFFFLFSFCFVFASTVRHTTHSLRVFALKAKVDCSLVAIDGRMSTESSSNTYGTCNTYEYERWICHTVHISVKWNECEWEKREWESTEIKIIFNCQTNMYVHSVHWKKLSNENRPKQEYRIEHRNKFSMEFDYFASGFSTNLRHRHSTYANAIDRNHFHLLAMHAEFSRSS